MQHEAFFGFAFEAFEALHVVAGAERCCYQRLGFAAGEDGAAVGAGQDAGFDPDVADFVEGAGIRTALLFDHFLAEDALAQSLVILLELCLRFFVVFGDFGLQLLLDFFDQRVAFGLGMLLGVERVGQFRADFLFQRVVVGLVEFRRRDFALLLAGLGAQIVDGGADFLDLRCGRIRWRRRPLLR